MSSEFIDSFTRALNALSPSPSSARLDFDSEEPQPRDNIQASATKHALHALLVSFPSSQPLNAQQICNAVSVLSRLRFSVDSDSEEEALKHIVVAKVMVGLYTKALKIYLDQATEAEAEAEWWREIEHSKLNVAWYLLQSALSFSLSPEYKVIPARILAIPARLCRAIDAVVTAAGTRNRRMSLSSFTPSSLARLFLTSPFQPNALTTACFPRLSVSPLSVTASLYSLPVASTSGTRLSEKVTYTLSYYLNLIVSYITYPLSLTLHECRSNRRDLENIRNQRAEILGQLSQMRNNLSSIFTNPECEHSGITQFFPTVQRFVEILNQKAAVEVVSAYPSLVEALVHVSNDTLPELDRSHRRMLKANRLLRPRRWILIWPKIVFFPPLVLYACRSLYASRASLEDIAREALETLKGFVRGWLLEPLRDVLMTIRSGSDDGTGMLVHKEGVLADLEVSSICD